MEGSGTPGMRPPSSSIVCASDGICAAAAVIAASNNSRPPSRRRIEIIPATPLVPRMPMPLARPLAPATKANRTSIILTIAAASKCGVTGRARRHRRNRRGIGGRPCGRACRAATKPVAMEAASATAPRGARQHATITEGCAWQTKRSSPRMGPTRSSSQRESPISGAVADARSTQPFCDGSHKETDIEPLRFVVEYTGTFNICGCKATDDEPFCDGTHLIL